MRPHTFTLVALTAWAISCERPDLGDDTDTSDTSDDTADTSDDTADTGDTGSDTGNPDTSDTDSDSQSETGNPDSGFDTSDTSDTDVDTDVDGGACGATNSDGWFGNCVYPSSPSCDDTLANKWGVVPKADGSWMAAGIPTSGTPVDVHQIRVLMRHGTDSQGTVCDASGEHNVRVYVTTNGVPPNTTGTALTPLFEHTFAPATVSGITRTLLVEVDPPVAVPNPGKAWVVVDGNLPGGGTPSCWQACKTGNFVDQQQQNFYTNAASPTSWTWLNLKDYDGSSETDMDMVEFMVTIWTQDQ